MKSTFTPEYIRANKGCYKHSQVDKLSFITKKEITIQDLLESEMPLKDKYWWVINKCDLTVRQTQELAISVAEIVLEIYEKKYPENKAAREAIQAAKDYLNGSIDLDVLREKRRAAYAAAAYAAAYAAAAYAAAYAAAAYAAAYAAAAAAAKKKTFTEILLINLMDFTQRHKD